jgi:hypothetical protein
MGPGAEASSDEGRLRYGCEDTPWMKMSAALLDRASSLVRKRPV